MSPFEYTSSQFVDTFSKGKQQALALYRCLLREGSLRETLSSFANAPALYENMTSSLDLTTLHLDATYEEDSTIRFLTRTHDNHAVESVIIPMEHGDTLCVSSQIGCNMGCSFCRTARLGLTRNLSAAEIVQQLFIARFSLHRTISNVVFMGMGEPLDNYDAVVQASNILSDQNGFAIGAKHITVSTCGLIKPILALAKDPHFHSNLTVSINAPTDKLRARLMPSRRHETLSLLHNAIVTYMKTKKKKVYLSYILLDNINDSLEMADELITYIQGLDTRINLIPYNSFPGSAFKSPSEEKINTFLSYLRKRNVPVLLRGTKGDSINAACGQLAAES